MPSTHDLPLNKCVYAEFALKASDDGIEGIVTGIANCMNLVDLGDDIILPGSFAKTLKDHRYRFPLDWDHRPGLQNECGVCYLAEKGNDLVMERGILNMAKKDVKDSLLPVLLQRMEHEIPAGLSIEYAPIKWKYVEKSGRTIREIAELKLFKLAICDIPMSQNADGTRGSFLDSVKSYQAARQDAPTDAMPEALPEAPLPETAARSDTKGGRRFSAYTLQQLTDGARALQNDLTTYTALHTQHSDAHRALCASLDAHVQALTAVFSPDSVEDEDRDEPAMDSCDAPEPTYREVTETGEPLSDDDLPKSAHLLALVAKALSTPREPATPTLLELIANGLPQ